MPFFYIVKEKGNMFQMFLINTQHLYLLFVYMHNFYV